MASSYVLNRLEDIARNALDDEIQEVCGYLREYGFGGNSIFEIFGTLLTLEDIKQAEPFRELLIEAFNEKVTSQEVLEGKTVVALDHSRSMYQNRIGLELSGGPLEIRIVDIAMVLLVLFVYNKQENDFIFYAQDIIKHDRKTFNKNPYQFLSILRHSYLDNLEFRELPEKVFDYYNANMLDIDRLVFITDAEYPFTEESFEGKMFKYLMDVNADLEVHIIVLENKDLQIKTSTIKLDQKINYYFGFDSNNLINALVAVEESA